MIWGYRYFWKHPNPLWYYSEILQGIFWKLQTSSNFKNQYLPTIIHHNWSVDLNKKNIRFHQPWMKIWNIALNSIRQQQLNCRLGPRRHLTDGENIPDTDEFCRRLSMVVRKHPPDLTKNPKIPSDPCMVYLPGTCECPLFWREKTLPNKGLFQSKPGSFGF